MIVNLLALTPNAEKLIEYAARICYHSQDKITEKSYKTFIPKILKKQHEDVIEHALATFEILGISRACSHELVRHRLTSISQLSQRYVSAENFNFVVPDSIVVES